MLRKITCCFLAGLFLTSSFILPLGDFSLLRDIPQMYRNYTRITCTEEMGALDFIGDYLMHGKDIFGHNEHDKIPAKGDDVQFQHQASPLSIVFSDDPIVLITAPVSVLTHPLFIQQFYNANYRSELFRPPIA